MGFIFTLIYVALVHVAIGETLPFLAPYRVMIWMTVLALLATVVDFQKGQRALGTPQALLFACFLAMVPLSNALNGWLGGIPVALIDFLPTAVCMILVLLNVNTPERARTLFASFIILALYMCLRGIVDYHFGEQETPFVLAQHTLVDEETWAMAVTRRVRFLGYLGDPNDFAQYLLICLPVLWLFRSQTAGVANLILVYAPAAFFLYTIFCTKSRGGVLGLAAIVAMVLRQRMNKVTAAAFSGAIAFGLLALQLGAGRVISIGGGTDRLNIWSDGLGIWRSSPLWGVGYRSFTDNANINAHNSFILAAAELGLVGLFFWIGMIVFTFMSLNRAIRETTDPAWRQIAIVTRLSMVAYLVTSYFLSRTYSPDFFMLVAISAAVAANCYVKLTPDGQVDLTGTSGGGMWLNAVQRLPVTQGFAMSLLCTIGALVSVYLSVRMRAF